MMNNLSFSQFRIYISFNGYSSDTMVWYLLFIGLYWIFGKGAGKGVKVLLSFILNFSDFLTKFVTRREGGAKNGHFLRYVIFERSEMFYIILKMSDQPLWQRFRNESIKIHIKVFFSLGLCNVAENNKIFMSNFKSFWANFLLIQ